MGASCACETMPSDKVAIIAEVKQGGLSKCSNISVVKKDSKGMLNHRLLVAARDNDVEAIKQALAEGAYLETRRPFVMRPKPVDEPDAKPAASSKKNKNREGLTPLMYAVQNASVVSTKLLLEAKASVNSCDEDGFRPLHFAAGTGDAEVCQLLVLFGADRDATDEFGRKAIEHVPADCMTNKAERTRWEATLGRPPATASAPGVQAVAAVPGVQADAAAPAAVDAVAKEPTASTSAPADVPTSAPAEEPLQNQELLPTSTPVLESKPLETAATAPPLVSLEAPETAPATLQTAVVASPLVSLESPGTEPTPLQTDVASPLVSLEAPGTAPALQTAAKASPLVSLDAPETITAPLQTAADPLLVSLQAPVTTPTSPQKAAEAAPPLISLDILGTVEEGPSPLAVSVFE